ncbi:MAG: hypothetical protein WCK27_08525 [Verrucomicrobiota bacterium]
MNYQTVEVELNDGRVWPRKGEPLPPKAHALLTILEPGGSTPPSATTSAGAGLRRFLSAPDFPLTLEQFRSSMEVDFFEQ